MGGCSYPTFVWPQFSPKFCLFHTSCRTVVPSEVALLILGLSRRRPTAISALFLFPALTVRTGKFYRTGGLAMFVDGSSFSEIIFRTFFSFVESVDHERRGRGLAELLRKTVCKTSFSLQTCLPDKITQCFPHSVSSRHRLLAWGSPLFLPELSPVSRLPPRGNDQGGDIGDRPLWPRVLETSAAMQPYLGPERVADECQE